MKHTMAVAAGSTIFFAVKFFSGCPLRAHQEDTGIEVSDEKERIKNFGGRVIKRTTKLERTAGEGGGIKGIK
jgi:hypothetical protein